MALLITTGFALSGAAQEVPPPEPTRTIEGRLVADVGGTPLAEATLVVWKADRLGGGALAIPRLGRPIEVLRTEGDGRFITRIAPTDAVVIEVLSPLIGEQIDVEPGGSIDLGDVELPATGAIKGRLLGPEGEVVTRGFAHIVRIELAGEEPDRIFSGRQPSLRVDEKGEFLFGSLSAGRYQLVGQGPPLSNSEISDEVEVVRGQYSDEVVLKLRPPGRLVGRVMDRDGEPVAGAQVALSLQTSLGGSTGNRRRIRYGFNETFQVESKSQADGTYVIEAPASEIPYVFICRSDDLGVWQTEVKLDAENETVLDAVLAQGGIRGHVLGADGERLKSLGWVHLLHGVHRNPGRLRPKPEIGISGYFPSQDAFRFDSLEPGIYTIVAYQGMGFVSDPVEVRPNEISEVVMQAPERPTLKLRIVDAEGQPLPEAWVTLNHLEWGYRDSNDADEQGIWEKSGVEPGDYRVSVRFENVPLLTEQIRVEPKPGVQEHVLRPRAKRTLVPIVVTRGGEPVARTKIHIRSLVDGSSYQGETGATGALHVEGLPPGAAMLSYRRTQVPIELPAKASAPFRVAIPTGRIRGELAKDLFALDGRKVILLASDAGAVTLFNDRFVRLEGEPEFEIEDLPAGPFDVYYVGPTEADPEASCHWIRRVSLAKDEQKDLGVVRPAEIDTGRLRIRLQHASGPMVQQEGTLPVILSESGVVIPPGLYLRPETTQEKGVFESDPLPVGDYLVVLRSSEYAAPAQKITIRANETAETTLWLDTGGALRVRVVDAKGTPRPSTEVELLTEKGEPLPLSGGTGSTISSISDTSGRVTWPHLPPARYRLRARQGEPRKDIGPFEIRLNEVTELELVLD